MEHTGAFGQFTGVFTQYSSAVNNSPIGFNFSSQSPAMESTFVKTTDKSAVYFNGGTMKRVSAFVLSCVLTSSAFAAPAPQAATTTTTTRSKTTRRKTASPAVTAADIQSLKDALAAQQQQIQQLQQELQTRDQSVQQLQQRLDQSSAATTQAQQKADQAVSQASQQEQTVSTLKTDVSDLKQNVTSTALTVQESQKESEKSNEAIKALGKLKFSGDLRLRYEPFWGGGLASAAAPGSRQRERFRLRFNVNTAVTDDLAVGFSLASGDTGDPISTNQTLTGFYTRKPITIDRAFATYHPHAFKALSITGGKFAYTWLRTELTWDNDLNPDGASATLGWDWKNKFLNHLALVTYATPIFEVSAGPDAFMEGGQIQTGWTLVPKVKLTADAGYYDFHRADSIAQNQTGGNGFPTNGTTTSAGGSFGFGGSSNTNNFGTIGGKRIFASDFGIVDAIARLDIDTGSKRWPVYALIDFVQNTRACSNLQAFVTAGVTPPACDSRQRHGYWSEFKVGQTKNKGDLLLGYTFARIERDAVLAAFDFSDLRQPTNVVEHRFEAYYQALAHVQVGVTGLIGRQLVTAQSPSVERYLKRLQFDTIFTF